MTETPQPYIFFSPVTGVTVPRKEPGMLFKLSLTYSQCWWRLFLSLGLLKKTKFGNPHCITFSLALGWRPTGRQTDVGLRLGCATGIMLRLGRWVGSNVTQVPLRFVLLHLLELTQRQKSSSATREMRWRQFKL